MEIAELPRFKHQLWMEDTPCGLEEVTWPEIEAASTRARRELKTVAPTRDTIWYRLAHGLDVGFCGLIAIGGRRTEPDPQNDWVARGWRMKAQWVAPEWRGEGYGRSLIIGSIHQARDRAALFIETITQRPDVLGRYGFTTVRFTPGGDVMRMRF